MQPSIGDGEDSQRDPKIHIPIATPEGTCEEVVSHVRREHVINTNNVLDRFRFPSKSKCRFNIPLCRFIALPVVRPALQTDVDRLALDFTHGYKDGDRAFIVSVTGLEGETVPVSENIRCTWNEGWKKKNDEFEDSLKLDPALAPLSGIMFHVYDGNHRLKSWMPIIQKEHSHDLNWHFMVETIVLNVGVNLAVLIPVMNDINRYYSTNTSL